MQEHEGNKIPTYVLIKSKGFLSFSHLLLPFHIKIKSFTVSLLTNYLCNQSSPNLHSSIYNLSIITICNMFHCFREKGERFDAEFQGTMSNHHFVLSCNHEISCNTTKVIRIWLTILRNSFKAKSATLSRWLDHWPLTKIHWKVFDNEVSLILEIFYLINNVEIKHFNSGSWDKVALWLTHFHFFMLWNRQLKKKSFFSN